MLKTHILFIVIAADGILPITAIPDCSGGIHKGRMITSPSYTGRYQDGQGTYVTRDNETHPYVFPIKRKCWWDYYTIEGEVFFTPWVEANGDLCVSLSVRLFYI